MTKCKIIKFPTTARKSGREDTRLEWDINGLKRNYLKEAEGDMYAIWDADMDLFGK